MHIKLKLKFPSLDQSLRIFPWELFIAKMSVSTCLLINRISQVQISVKHNKMIQNKHNRTALKDDQFYDSTSVNKMSVDSRVLRTMSIKYVIYNHD